MLFSKVVGALLIDLTAAQDAANEYSSQLSLKYKQDNDEEHNVLSDFPVPNAILKEIELELKFTINELKTQVGSLDLAAVTEMFTQYARESARRATDLLIDFINTSKGFAEDRGKWDKVTENVQSERFINYITDKVAGALLQERNRLLGGDGKLKAEEVQKVIANTLKQHLLEHPDLKSIFSPGTRTRSKIRQNYEQEMSKFLGELKLPVPERLGSNTVPSVDIVVSADKLKDLPVEIVSSLKLKAQLTNYRWAITETSENLYQVQ